MIYTITYYDLLGETCEEDLDADDEEGVRAEFELQHPGCKIIMIVEA